MIDIGYYIEAAIEWLTKKGAGFFDALNVGVESFIDSFQLALYTIPFYIFRYLPYAQSRKPYHRRHGKDDGGESTGNRTQSEEQYRRNQIDESRHGLHTV